MLGEYQMYSICNYSRLGCLHSRKYFNAVSNAAIKSCNLVLRTGLNNDNFYQNNSMLIIKIDNQILIIRTVLCSRIPVASLNLQNGNLRRNCNNAKHLSTGDLFYVHSKGAKKLQTLTDLVSLLLSTNMQTCVNSYTKQRESKV